ncbi:hypothetical protein J4Q44_G00008550 [Coregonus suidteri]|uniref:Uncharacterized protein n=1 Tax=Coregonus suidteri TaxID=861788 RepID=A0AAN8MN04_9TELE
MSCLQTTCSDPRSGKLWQRFLQLQGIFLNGPDGSLQCKVLLALMTPRRSTTTATQEPEGFQRTSLGSLLQDGGSWDEPLRLPQRKLRPL